MCSRKNLLLDQSPKRGRLAEGSVEDALNNIVYTKENKEEDFDSEEEFESILNDAIQQSRERALIALKVESTKFCNFIRLSNQSHLIKGITFQETIFPHQMQQLRSSTAWLGSTIIDVYASLIAEDFPTIGVFSSHFFRNDSNNMAAGTENWVRKSDALEKDFIFIPLNTKNTHWSLLVIDMQNRIVAHLNSLVDNSRSMRERVKICIDEVTKLVSKVGNISLDIWQRRPRCPCPKQNNDHDCGVFVCYFMRFLAESVRPNKNSCPDPFSLLSKLTAIDAFATRRTIESRLLQS